ncbi:MAG: hypothetical protein R3B93_08815 [Bacteroidia bacterium]
MVSEGVTNGGWCCSGTCTHVLELRTIAGFSFSLIRAKHAEIEFLNNTFKNGFQTHRSVLPIGDYWTVLPLLTGKWEPLSEPTATGKFSGDDEWLRKIWPESKEHLNLPDRLEKLLKIVFNSANQNAWDLKKQVCFPENNIILTISVFMA